MDANVVGLIELENGLCANLHDCNFTDSEHRVSDLEQSLACLEEMASEETNPFLANNTSRGHYHTFQTRFVRANVEHLNEELNYEFQRLLVRLFESNE